MEQTLTGHGSGADFLQQILAYMRENVVAKKVLLDVGEFNVLD